MSFGIPVRNGLGVGLLASTFLSSRRAAYPAMSLNFLQPFLDSRITFSRGSNATLVDATGKIVYAPANLLTYSQEFDNAAWTKQGLGVAVAPTVTANAGLAPDGTMTADRVQFSLNGGTTLSDSSQIVQGVTFADATYIFSVWLKSNTGSSQTVILLNVNSGGPAETVTTEWTRFTRLVSTAASASNAGVRIRGTVTGATADVLMWGAQLEPVTYQTTPSTYVATTASAYYGPRFDYDPVTLAPKGLLIEEARTNLATYSQDFTNAAWALGSATITANSTTSPDGTTNADTLTSAAATAATYAQQSFTATAVAHTFSLYVKANGARYIQLLWAGTLSTNYANFDLTTATVTAGTYTSAAITSAANGWFRVNITSTLAAAAGAVNVYLVDSGAAARAATFTGNGTSGLFLYGAQLEAGSFATSYIPTVASTVTRSADVATMTGTNFSSWFNTVEGTFISAFDVISTAGASKAVVTTNDGTSNNINIVYVASGGSVTNEVRSGGAVQAALSSGSVTASVAAVSGFAYKVNDFAVVLNGGAASTDALGSVAVGQTAINIGYSSNYGGLYANGHIRSIAYYNTRLPNAQLQTLTAPSLATTLSLSFTNQAYTVGV